MWKMKKPCKLKREKFEAVENILENNLEQITLLNKKIIELKKSTEQSEKNIKENKNLKKKILVFEKKFNLNNEITKGQYNQLTLDFQKLKEEVMIDIKNNMNVQSDLKNTINEFIKFMIEERDQKNNYFNKKVDNLENNMLLLTNELSKNNINVFEKENIFNKDKINDLQNDLVNFQNEAKRTISNTQNGFNNRISSINDNLKHLEKNMNISLSRKDI